MIEELQVWEAQFEEQFKSVTRKFQKATKEKSELIGWVRELEDNWERLESDKSKLSEKWIKLSARQKGECKLKEKIKQLESLVEDKEAEIGKMAKQVEKC